MATQSDALQTLQGLSERLSHRASELLTYQRYYDGDHPKAYETAEYREKFGKILDALVDNYCRMIVKAKSERMIVQGFLFGGDEADDEASRIWQANRMDALSRQAHDEALVKKVAYATVWPTSDPATPRIAVESPLQTIVDYEPGDRTSRTAALKRWKAADKHLHATVYLPDEIWKFRTDQPYDRPLTVADQVKWVPRVDGTNDQGMMPNPHGVVPVVPLPNDPEMLTEGRSELVDAIPIQDAINKLWHDLMIASDFGAFVQKVLTGVEAPIDPKTKQPLEGWKPDISRIMTTGNENAKAYSFDATELSNFISAIERAIASLAIKTRTPPHYLNSSADRLSGESIKSSETGLTSSVKEKLEYFGEGWEEVMRLAFTMAGDTEKASIVDAETLWRDPEVRSEEGMADKASKLADLGMPFRQLVRDLGYSESEIKRILEWRRQEQLERQAVDLSDLDAGPNREPDVA